MNDARDEERARSERTLRLALAAFGLGMLISGVGAAVTEAASHVPPPSHEPAPATPAPRANPPQVAPSFTLGARPTVRDENLVVLFDGTSWENFHARDGSPSGWRVQDDGSVLIPAERSGGDAISNEEFGDFQLHLEFLSPEIEGAQGQHRGNSGVYLQGVYEIQVLDSEGDPPLGNGCGAIYSIASPLVNAARPGGEWQTYDILFRAPRFDESGQVAEHARVTVLHNGVVIHNNLELPHATPGGLGDDPVARGPILLQDHGNPVRYRNIWARRLDP